MDCWLKKAYELEKMYGADLHKSDDERSLIQQPHIMMTAENPLHPAKTKMTNEQLHAHLESIGEKPMHIKGHYGSPERSLFIPRPNNPDKIRQIAKELGQESVLESDGSNHILNYVNGPKEGQSEAGSGTDFHEQAPEDYYSVMPGGTTFTHRLG
jgi:hypothetical protein